MDKLKEIEEAIENIVKGDETLAIDTRYNQAIGFVDGIYYIDIIDVKEKDKLLEYIECLMEAYYEIW